MGERARAHDEFRCLQKAKDGFRSLELKLQVVVTCPGCWDLTQVICSAQVHGVPSYWVTLGDKYGAASGNLGELQGEKMY